MFLVHLVNSLDESRSGVNATEKENLQEIIYNMMEVKQGDH